MIKNPLLLIVFLSTVVCACTSKYSGKRVYNDSNEMWEIAHDKLFGDFLNAWGEPTSQRYAGSGDESVIICTWDSSKVNVGNCSEIAVTFSVLEARDGNGHYQSSPFQPLRYSTCDGEGRNTQNKSSTYQENKRNDICKLCNNTGITICPNCEGTGYSTYGNLPCPSCEFGSPQSAGTGYVKCIFHTY